MLRAEQTYITEDGTIMHCVAGHLVWTAKAGTVPTTKFVFCWYFVGFLQISCFPQFLIMVLNIYMCSLLVVDISCCYNRGYQRKAVSDCIFAVYQKHNRMSFIKLKTNQLAHAPNIFITWRELVAHPETWFGVSVFLTHCLVNNLTERVYKNRSEARGHHFT